ncbi:DUF1656 domain-containing protein [Photobacterium lipolyticum]|uniref:DUF1656 domain-containing protein n=1 Tax=Photobacterium lipolyticum TaxID=266810 RepID=A0A2T3N376_9GAMM|nr:DUF1656 domain-containing protein [Photobacterium lipolyticum]PSW06808.1 DUF1656 domain-containing protein [Photobacterium lipolyticum]
MNTFLSAAPREIALSDLYVPPLLVAALIGLVFTSVTVRLMNKLRWHRFFVIPPLVELSLTVIYTVLISIFFIPS